MRGVALWLVLSCVAGCYRPSAEERYKIALDVYERHHSRYARLLREREECVEMQKAGVNVLLKKKGTTDQVVSDTRDFSSKMDAKLKEIDKDIAEQESRINRAWKQAMRLEQEWKNETPAPDPEG